MGSIKMCDNPDLASKSNSMIISAMNTYVCTDIGITIYFYQVYSCKYSSIVNKKRKKKQAKSLIVSENEWKEKTRYSKERPNVGQQLVIVV
jgi:cytidylate kinase